MKQKFNSHIWNLFDLYFYPGSRDIAYIFVVRFKYLYIFWGGGGEGGVIEKFKSFVKHLLNVKHKCCVGLGYYILKI